MLKLHSELSSITYALVPRLDIFYLYTSTRHPSYLTYIFLDSVMSRLDRGKSCTLIDI